MREHEHYESEPVRERIYEEVPRDVVHEREIHERPVVHDSGPSWTGFALIKYGFILVMVVVILYFIAQFVLPLLP